jgi:endonuclease/exonuclease/phosphatase family metal-dependent hydrolase
MKRKLQCGFTVLAALALLPVSLTGADVFRVATYNVENYLDRPSGSRKAKSTEAKAKVRDNILALNPDILALQEMGSPSALHELQSSLKGKGLDLPYSEWIAGWDTNIHVAVLSRFPFTRRQPHTNEAYLLSGRRLHVSRGFAEVDIQVDEDYRFTLFTAHLKSKRRIGIADESEMRLEEAKVLRRLVDERLASHPTANILVCGDLNDFYNTPPVKVLRGRGRTELHDTRPAERNGDNQPNPHNPLWFPRNVTWTHHYGAEDTYSRIDYILLSPGMTSEWQQTGTYVLTAPNWGVGSDHRPILATFTATDQ